MLDNRLLALLTEMIKMPVLTFWELSNIFEMPVQQIKKDIETIQEVLLNYQIEGLMTSENGYEMTDDFSEGQELLVSWTTTQLILTEEERIELIYLFTFSREELLSNFHYQYLLQVSKNTIIADLKKVNHRTNQEGVEVKYTRAKGYHLKGDELAKRQLAIISVGKLLNNPTGKWLLDYLLKDKGALAQLVNQAVTKELKAYDVSLVTDRLETTLYMICLLTMRTARVKEPASRDSLPEAILLIARRIITKVYPMTSNAYEEHFLGTLLLGGIEGNYQEKDTLFRELTEKIVAKMEQVAVLSFDNREQLVNNLYAHLVPAYYRLVYRTTFQNDLTDYIKYTHYTLFELVKEALSPLADLAGREVPEDEISYFVAHFGGQIENMSQPIKKTKALIICLNGISSSLILKQELQQLFPQFHWLEHRSVAAAKELATESYDLVFSTTYFSSSKPLYIVKPLMDELFKQYLVQKVSKDFHLVGFPTLDVDEIMATMARFGTIHQKAELKDALLKKLLPENNLEGVNVPVLKDLVTANRISIMDNDEGMTWQSAIRLSGQPLLAEGMIEPSYLEAIIDKVQTLGAFIDIGSGIAIPHARPEEGVNQLGMSILKLAHPVQLLDDPNHSVTVLICIAAIDNVTHLKALSQLTKILMDKGQLSRLKSAITKEEIMALIEEGGGKDD